MMPNKLQQFTADLQYNTLFRRAFAVTTEEDFSSCKQFIHPPLAVGPITLHNGNSQLTIRVHLWFSLQDWHFWAVCPCPFSLGQYQLTPKELVGVWEWDGWDDTHRFLLFAINSSGAYNKTRCWLKRRIYQTEIQLCRSSYREQADKNRAFI